MKLLSLNAKRVVAGVYLAVLLFFVANRYLEWRLFGTRWDKGLLAFVQFVGLILVVRYVPAMVEEMKEYRRRKRSPSPTNDA